MNYHIHITKKAKEDMVQAADYIEFTLLNPDTAGVTSMDYMFAGCLCLTNITAPDDLAQEAEQHRDDEYVPGSE